jgi:hypothetical protein
MALVIGPDGTVRQMMGAGGGAEGGSGSGAAYSSRQAADPWVWQVYAIAAFHSASFLARSVGALPEPGCGNVTSVEVYSAQAREDVSIFGHPCQSQQHLWNEADNSVFEQRMHCFLGWISLRSNQTYLSRNSEKSLPQTTLQILVHPLVSSKTQSFKLPEEICPQPPFPRPKSIPHPKGSAHPQTYSQISAPQPGPRCP